MLGSELLSNQFIEASAGTGKTYTIEQFVKRLVCEQGISLGEVLIVTFTNAATFELKQRIREQLKEHHHLLQAEEAIYTIHGFCQRVLKDFAFETQFPIEISDPTPDFWKKIAKEGLVGDLSFLHPKQIEILFSFHRQDSDAIVSHLARLISCRIPIKVGPSYDEINAQIQALLADVKPQEFLADLVQLTPFYKEFCNRKREIKPELLAGLQRLSNGEWMESPLKLFRPSNRSQRQGELTLHYPQLVERLLALAEKALDPLEILASVAERVRLKAEALISENEWIFFDDLIQKMCRNVFNPQFAAAVRERYKVVIIDEFQDTDPDQWKIFSTLFLGHRPLFLVGDPKQAIYRFRRADIYTYLEAKKQLANISTLDTNYRATPALVEGLNTLFADLVFPLPRLGEELLYQPVKSGKQVDDLIPPLVLLRAQDEQELFQKVITAISAHPHLTAAVLVKDRYQAERFAAVCPMPVRLRRARSLLHSPALSLLEDLLRGILFPQDQEILQKLIQGRLSSCKEEHFWSWHQHLQTRGLLSCVREVLKEVGPELIQQREGELLFQDLLHLAEVLEQREEEDPLEALDGLLQEDEESEALKGRQLLQQGAVEVMTIHVSKGLEFDLVFPVGLALTPTQKRDFVYAEGQLTACEQAWREHQKELEAEMLRQVYVACTRPKKRLYLPLIEGEDSPLAALLANKVFPELQEQANFISTPPEVLIKPPSLVWNVKPIPIVSFTSLANPHFEKKQGEASFPTGAEVGVILHRILEEISFQQPDILPYVQGTILEPHIPKISEMIQRILNTPLPDGFTLAEVDEDKMIRELAFLYPYQGGYCKGFIDLVFEHANTTYLIDWKSNVVQGSLYEEAIHHDYLLQASLYREAVSRLLNLEGKNRVLKVYYVFLREEKEPFLEL